MALAVKPATLKVLLLTPANIRRSPRVARVREALGRAGVDVKAIADVLARPPSKGFLTDRAMTWVLHQVSQVVVVPRIDSTIGRGTHRDIELAVQLGKPVYIVNHKGQLIALDKAGMAMANERTQAIWAWFTWSP